MPFQLKDFPSIAASMINHARATQSKLTDFNVGSVARTILEAPAIEIEELYQQMWNGLMEAIPVSIYNAFGFARTPASAAVGVVRIIVTPSATPSTVPAGSIFEAAGDLPRTFVSLGDTTIAVSASFVDVQVRAQQPGAVGNVPAGSAFSVQPAISAMLSASALAAFVGGRDEETDAQQKARFAAFIRTISRSTAAALDFGVRSAAIRSADGAVVEQVQFQSIVEPWLTDLSQPPALVNVYIHNGVDGASAALLEEVRRVLFGYRDATGKIVPGWKAAGVRVDVYAATSVAVPVAGTVAVEVGYEAAAVVDQVSAAITDYIAALDIGDDVLCAEIVAAAMGVSGVVNYLPTAPAGDVAIAAASKAIPGALTITVAA
jgi:uncharacterized phage protein gp47/JayE